MPSCALISDIHGNIDALDAVLEDIEGGPAVDTVVCLGDIIGYCPGVNEVIDRLRELGERTTVRYNLGSHDGAALGEYQFVDLQSETDAAMLRAAGLHSDEAVASEYLDAKRRRFVPVRAEARDAMQWTLEHLSEASLQFLMERLEPVVTLEPGIISVHGSPRDPLCEYVRDDRAAQGCFESPEMAGIWICFVGHTHLPVVWRMPKSQTVEIGSSRVCLKPPIPDFGERFTLRRDATYLINIGSVGQPRDRDPRAAYARFNSTANSFEHVRVEYDVERAMARVREAGLAERLAERLKEGK
jgi:diadenosine tetraphosphatase ApaH/serine/threonine PP2A family protein phosphatase